MATIVLTTVGTLIGGPIGGAVGALVGQSVDQFIFAPKGRQGPRLSDLAVQGSSYGQPLPRIHGRIRVAGQLIWATDLKETKSRSGGGKGQPSTVSYSYSASFAVALSARPILGVRRIWADGKLLRSAGGAWLFPVRMRVHKGGEDQAADPLIASAEGGATPAYRGLAYAVFEDMPLAEFGNRIPMLSFEVEADSGPVAGTDLIVDAASGLVEARGPTRRFAGFGVSGAGNLRALIESLDVAGSVSLTDDGATLRLDPSGDGPAQTVAASHLGAAGGSGASARLMRSVRPDNRVAGKVVLSYLDVDRDYQQGLQRATVGNAVAREDRIELPAALGATAAKAIADDYLATLGARRRTATISLPLADVRFRPGDLVTLPGEAGRWTVRRWSLEDAVVTLDLAQAAVVPASPLGDSDAGRVPGQQIADQGETLLHAFELPAADGALSDEARLWVACVGTEAGWRGADLSSSDDGGLSWQSLGFSYPGLVAGVTASVLPAGTATMIDGRATVDILLAHDGMAVEGCSLPSLLAGRNVALIGNELVQFAAVEQLGPRHVRLLTLLRGRRGTEAAMAGHAAGERFILIEPSQMISAPIAIERLGATMRVRAALSGAAPDSGPDIGTVVDGRFLRPLAPAFLNARRDGAGDILIEWIRRDRTQWGWLDGGDADAEAGYRYRLRLAPAGGSERVATVDGPAFTYRLADQMADRGSPVDSLLVEIAQVSPRMGPGDSAARLITLP